MESDVSAPPMLSVIQRQREGNGWAGLDTQMDMIGQDIQT